MWSAEHRVNAIQRDLQRAESNSIAFNRERNAEIEFLEDQGIDNEEIYIALFSLSPNSLKTISWIRAAEKEEKREKLIWEDSDDNNYYWNIASYSSSFLTDEEIEKMDAYRNCADNTIQSNLLKPSGEIFIKPAA